MSKKSLAIIIIAIVALAVLGVWVLNTNKNFGGFKFNQTPEQKTGQNEPAKKDQTPVIPETKITEYKANELPGDFPSNMPLEAGAVVLANYTSLSPAGVQSTRRFESKKTLTENFKIYSDYLKNNGWTINGTTNEPLIKSLSGKNSAGNMLSISMSQNNQTKKNEVDISLLIPVK